MNAANPTLCAELEKVSGWRATDDQLVWAYFGKTEPKLMLKRELYRTNGTINPEVKVVTAFDCGYVMDRLPMSIEYSPRKNMMDGGYGCYIVIASGEWGSTKIVKKTADDAAAELALALFEQGVLKWEVPA